MKKLLIIALLVVSCGKSDKELPEPKPEPAEPGREYALGELKGVDVGFYVSRLRGGSILNPDDPQHLPYNRIKVYDLVNGEKILRTNPTSDPYPKGFKVFTSESDNAPGYNLWGFALPPYFDISALKTTSYIEWGDIRTDTVEWVRYQKIVFPTNAHQVLPWGDVLYNRDTIYKKGWHGMAPFLSIRVE